MFNQGLHLGVLGVGEKARPSLFHLFLPGVVRVLNAETAVLEERRGAAGVLGARAKETAPSRFRTLHTGRKLVRRFSGIQLSHLRRRLARVPAVERSRLAFASRYLFR